MKLYIWSYEWCPNCIPFYFFITFQAAKWSSCFVFPPSLLSLSLSIKAVIIKDKPNALISLNSETKQKPNTALHKLIHSTTMAKSTTKKHKTKKLSYISVPSQIINSISSSSLQSLLDSPKKSSPRNSNFFFFFFNNNNNTRFRTLCFLFTLFLLASFFIFVFSFGLKSPFPPFPCGNSQPNGSISNGFHSKSDLEDDFSSGYHHDDGVLEFWKQPDGMGFRPCLDFSREYMRESERIVNERRKYLMVVVSGGLNQQRNQIVDAVVIARILGAVLVVPILQVNVIWGDER